MAQRKKQGFVTRLVNLAGKVRKGLHVYLKAPGKKGRYYKYQPDIPLDSWASWNVHTHHGGKGTLGEFKRRFRGETDVGPAAQQAYRRYLKRLQQRDRLSTAFLPGHGLTQTEFLLHEANLTTLRKSYEELLGPIVLDEELKRRIIADRAKLRHRFHTKLTVHGASGEMGNIEDIGKRLPEEIVAKYREEGSLTKGRWIWSQGLFELAKRLGVPTGAVRQWDQGEIKRVVVHIRFSKGN